MRIGHYKPETAVTLLDGRIDPPTFVTEEFRERYSYPGMTDEDLFCLVFFDFSRSIKVALLDEGPLTPQQVHDRGAEVYKRAQEERTRQSRERGKRRRIMNSYLDFCEDLYRRWSDNDLASAGWNNEALRKALSKRVCFEYAPEPYLVFDGANFKDVDAPQLVFLTTNPGAPQDFQSRERAVGRATYEALQAELVGKYEGEEHAKDVGPSAHRRIARMREIANELGSFTNAKGFVQCEAVPFHSNSLPGKRRLAKYLHEEGAQSALAHYQDSLRAFLADKHVISLDASNEPSNSSWEHWLRCKADLLGFNRAAEIHRKCLGESKKSGRSSTCVFSQPKGELIRAMYLTQGGNDFRKDTANLCAFLIGEARP